VLLLLCTAGSCFFYFSEMKRELCVAPTPGLPVLHWLAPEGVLPVKV
jgi:hypothetical protein